MHLEITPSHAVSLSRLGKCIIDYTRYLNQDSHVNIITESVFCRELSRYIDNTFSNIKPYISINSKDKRNVINIYFQFDFLSNIAIHFKSIYISSLRFPRTIRHINDWMLGKRQDVVLSLIALNNNSLEAWHPVSKQFRFFDFSKINKSELEDEKLLEYKKDSEQYKNWASSAFSEKNKNWLRLQQAANASLVIKRKCVIEKN